MSPVDIFTLQKRDARSASKLMQREGYGEDLVRICSMRSMRAGPSICIA